MAKLDWVPMEPSGGYERLCLCVPRAGKVVAEVRASGSRVKASTLRVLLQIGGC